MPSRFYIRFYVFHPDLFTPRHVDQKLLTVGDIALFCVQFLPYVICTGTAQSADGHRFWRCFRTLEPADAALMIRRQTTALLIHRRRF